MISPSSSVTKGFWGSHYMVPLCESRRIWQCVLLCTHRLGVWSCRSSSRKLCWILWRIRTMVSCRASRLPSYRVYRGRSDRLICPCRIILWRRHTSQYPIRRVKGHYAACGRRWHHQARKWYGNNSRVLMAISLRSQRVDDNLWLIEPSPCKEVIPPPPWLHLGTGCTPLAYSAVESSDRRIGLRW